VGDLLVGDLLAGAIVARKELIDQFRFVGIKEMNGACISAFDAFLVLRGLKTLSLRMDRHCETAMKLANHLEAHPAVSRVYYPGLDSHPQQSLARTQMSAFGGMIAIELRGGLLQRSGVLAFGLELGDQLIDLAGVLDGIVQAYILNLQPILFKLVDLYAAGLPLSDGRPYSIAIAAPSTVHSALTCALPPPPAPMSVIFWAASGTAQVHARAIVMYLVKRFRIWFLRQNAGVTPVTPVGRF